MQGGFFKIAAKIFRKAIANSDKILYTTVNTKRRAIWKHYKRESNAKSRKIVIKNAKYLNVFSDSWETGDIAVSGGLIAGIGGEYHGKTEIDAAGKHVIPGLIDAHIHLESAIVEPAEFARIALPHGTTTVVADPHEIANVMGTDGIRSVSYTHLRAHETD